MGQGYLYRADEKELVVWMCMYTWINMNTVYCEQCEWIMIEP